MDLSRDPEPREYLSFSKALLEIHWPPVARFYDECHVERENIGSSLRRIFASGEELDTVGVVVAMVLRGHGFAPYDKEEDGRLVVQPAMMAALEAMVLGIYLGQTRKAYIPDGRDTLS